MCDSHVVNVQTYIYEGYSMVSLSMGVMTIGGCWDSRGKKNRELDILLSMWIMWQKGDSYFATRSCSFRLPNIQVK